MLDRAKDYTVTKFEKPAETFGLSFSDLKRKVFPPVAWTVPGILPEGCAILAGKPKLGKSWLALDIAIGVARGGFVLGDRKCAQGDVLYLALEDNERRLQSRVNKMLQSEEWPTRVTVATEWPRANEGGIDKIKRWAASVQNPRLIIVDVLTAFRAHPGPAERKTAYATDYEAVAGLRDLANQIGCTVLIIHHTRKGGGDDPLEEVSGTLGLSGAADTILVLNRKADTGVTLYGRGRDIEEFDLAMMFMTDNCRWTIRGEAATICRSDERGEIIAELQDATEPMTPTDLAAATGMRSLNLRQLLLKMVKEGTVLKTGRGRYVHPERADLLRRSDADNNHTSDNIDNKITNVDEPDGGNHA